MPMHILQKKIEEQYRETATIILSTIFPLEFSLQFLSSFTIQHKSIVSFSSALKESSKQQ